MPSRLVSVRAAACSGPRLALLTALIPILVAGCSATKPPHRIDDACAIFREKKDWYSDALEARKRWGISIPIQLAFIRQESSFDGDARPPRHMILGFIPGSRPSNAHGYAQALESTWDEYRKAVGARGADRDEFADAVDFIGWYNARTSKMCGIAKDDAFRLYLAYHEGPVGYRRGTHRNKKWLLGTAERVATRAARYDLQLSRCEQELMPRRRGWFF
ncbi:MAG TPA: hypothetical protein VN634_09500 [Candidatus Limnocylindrales bacterium]|nr:hypothetical protein [Candidatus Limnocylindrales bacterium]